MPLIDPATDFATHAFLERVREHFDFAEAILFGSRARAGVLPDYRAPEPEVIWLDEESEQMALALAVNGG